MEEKEVEQDVELTKELVKIIRSLMHFIVVDGRVCIGEDKVKDYVARYLVCFMQSLNSLSIPIDQDRVKSQIEKDVNFFI